MQCSRLSFVLSFSIIRVLSSRVTPMVWLWFLAFTCYCHKNKYSKITLLYCYVLESVAFYCSLFIFITLDDIFEAIEIGDKHLNKEIFSFLLQKITSYIQWFPNRNHIKTTGLRSLLSKLKLMMASLVDLPYIGAIWFGRKLALWCVADTSKVSIRPTIVDPKGLFSIKNPFYKRIFNAALLDQTQSISLPLLVQMSMK